MDFNYLKNSYNHNLVKIIQKFKKERLKMLKNYNFQFFDV